MALADEPTVWNFYPRKTLRRLVSQCCAGRDEPPPQISGDAASTGDAALAIKRRRCLARWMCLRRRRLIASATKLVRRLSHNATCRPIALPVPTRSSHNRAPIFLAIFQGRADSPRQKLSLLPDPLKRYDDTLVDLAIESHGNLRGMQEDCVIVLAAVHYIQPPLGIRIRDGD